MIFLDKMIAKFNWHWLVYSAAPTSKNVKKEIIQPITHAIFA